MKTVKNLKQTVKNTKNTLRAIKKGASLETKFQKGQVLTCRNYEINTSDLYAFEVGNIVIHSGNDNNSFNKDWDNMNSIFAKWCDKFNNMSEQDIKNYMEDVKPYLPKRYLNKMSKDLIYICEGQNPRGLVSVVLLPGRQFEIHSCKKTVDKTNADCINVSYVINVIGDDTMITLSESQIEALIG